MDKHDYLVDNEDSKSSVDNDHAGESTQMCSYQQDELTENCSYRQDDTCGDHSCTTSDQLVRILYCRYFEMPFLFSSIMTLEPMQKGLNITVI